MLMKHISIEGKKKREFCVTDKWNRLHEDFCWYE